MSMYIGTKQIAAIPMNRLDYNTYRGWELPKDEDGTDEGYLVEYLDGGQSNHHNHNGYVSWSPKATFEASYNCVYTGVSLGQAVDLMKNGAYKVARKGWNGKGMFLYYVPANAYPAATPAAKKEFGENGLVPYSAYIAMKTATGEVVPWLASQTDLLADDWVLVD